MANGSLLQVQSMQVHGAVHSAHTRDARHLLQLVHIRRIYHEGSRTVNAGELVGQLTAQLSRMGHPVRPHPSVF